MERRFPFGPSEAPKDARLEASQAPHRPGQEVQAPDAEGHAAKVERSPVAELWRGAHGPAGIAIKVLQEIDKGQGRREPISDPRTLVNESIRPSYITCPCN